MLQSFSIAIPKEPPESLRLLSMGINETKKGDFVLDQEGLDQIMADAADWGNRHHFDYEHASLEPPADGAPAAGWYDLEARPDGLWAVGIEWTQRAFNFITSREYAYLSPTLGIMGDRIVAFINAALTNHPATKNMIPLRGPVVDKEDSMETVKTALSLAEAATEAEVLASVQDLHGQVASLTADADAVLALTGAPDRVAALATLSAWQQGAAKAEALQAELAGIKAEALATAKADLIARAVRDGQMAPAMQAWANDQPLETLEAFVASAPKVVKTDRKEQGQPKHEVSLKDALSEVENAWRDQGRKKFSITDLAVEARRRYPHLKGA